MLIDVSDQINRFVPDRQVYAVISCNGTVNVVWPEVISAHCPFNVQSFPFDTQVCTLVMGPWNYVSMQLKVVAHPGIGAPKFSENSGYLTSNTSF
jgi:hypothetical protein